MTMWQQLGTFVGKVHDLSDDNLSKFAAVGGRWLAVVLYNDGTAEQNRAELPGLKAKCAVRGIKVAGWYNGNGGDPIADAKAIAGIHSNLGLSAIILDLEYKYQYNPNDPECDPNKMPIMLAELRKYLPNAEIGVSTNGMNNSMIYNGRVLTPKQSFYDMRVRCLPQWYDPYYIKDGTTPQYQMKWLKQNGHSDGNFRDDNAPKTSYRGLPLSYVHPTVEHSTIEGANLSRELQDCVGAMAFGLTPGMSTYLLERAPDYDFTFLNQYRGKLYLG